MLVRAVAGVDHVGFEKAREEMRRACGFVADDDDVGIECFERARGVFKALAFWNDEESAEKLMMSALKRFAESSKLTRVRVEGSTKKFTTVLPWSAGTFLMSRSPTALNSRAVSSTVVSSSALRLSMSSRCLRCQLIF